MKLRTQLILAFFSLSVVPLTGIVLYSYTSSLRAFHQAVEAGAERRAEEIAQLMDTVAADLDRRAERLDWSFLPTLVDEERDLAEEFFGWIKAEMGDAAPLVGSLQYIPATPAVPVVVSGPRDMDPGKARHMPQGVVIYLDPDAAAEVESELAAEPEAHQAPGRFLRVIPGGRLRPDPEQERDRARRAQARLEHRIESVQRELQAEEHQIARMQELAIVEGDAVADLVEQTLEATRLKVELAALGARRERMRALLGRDFAYPVVTRDGRRVGQVWAQVKTTELLRLVLSKIRRQADEIPFVIDPQGTLHASRGEDHRQLEELRLDRLGTGQDPHPPVEVIDNWAVAKKPVPDSEFVLGLARPIDESLARIRRTAAQNFGLGAGMIGLALLGILPLSSRMTRNLKRLTQSAERLALGDLGTRLPVRSKDEFGQLALAFNRMAEDLDHHQRQLLEEERRRKEDEIQRRLLEVENRRKSAELEGARQFQLSLLPKALPSHRGLDIAVHTQTATEVGGDYYDFHQAADGTLTVAIGDATGHGAKAGTMVTVIKSLFTSQVEDTELAPFLDQATRSIKRMDLGRMSMALSLVRFHGTTLSVSSAGMPPLLVHRYRTGRVEEVTVEGLPLGALAEHTYREATTRLEAGDTVLLMTDGFPELMSPEAEVMGYGKVRQHFAAGAAGTPQEVVAHLATVVGSWTGGQAPGDDVTFVVVRVKGRGVGAAEIVQGGAVGPRRSIRLSDG